MDVQSTALVRQACSGNAEAFGELYELCSQELYRYACCVLGSQQMAQDAVHDAVCAAFPQITSLRNEEAFKAWLFKILSNVCKKYFAEMSRQRVAIPFDEDMEMTLEIKPSNLNLTLELRAALESLNHDEREIVLLHVIEGYNSREIASILDCPSGTVRSKLSRALKKLRVELDK